MPEPLAHLKCRSLGDVEGSLGSLFFVRYRGMVKYGQDGTYRVKEGESILSLGNFFSAA